LLATFLSAIKKSQQAESRMSDNLPAFPDVLAAADRIEGHAFRTPLLKSVFLDDLTGADVWLKPECLQRTGSFKFRGAYNSIAALSGEERKRGVLAVSSGNHAQGIAEAARLTGTQATILMPSDSPAIKVARTRRSGANVVFFDRATDDRDEISARLQEETGAVFIHPYDNPYVIAGQGTCGLEFCQDIREMGKRIDRVFVCTGGGGLTAGITLAVSEVFPEAKIHTGEPEDFDDYKRSLELGERVANERWAGSICDAIITPKPGALSFAICKDRLAGGKVVSDEEALAATAFAFNELKLVVEPGGAVALAALLQAGHAHAGETVVVTLSGGNVDPSVLARALEEGAGGQGGNG